MNTAPARGPIPPGSRTVDAFAIRPLTTHAVVTRYDCG
jgi:hypothetical protein